MEGQKTKGEFLDSRCFFRRAIASNLLIVQQRVSYLFLDTPALISPTTFILNMPVRAGDLFCGDTLFAGGCGRLFEGSPAQMVESLSKLQNLPDNTRVWCAHEYTLKNLQFALTVDGSNTDLQSRFVEVKAARSQRQATVPSMLGVEKRTNPFLRWNQPPLQSAVNSYEPVQTFARLRGMKDQF